nr:hypothetical chloroplast RF2 [Solanum mortonii]YP_010340992.1 hypothetical chloroplast RF2 [Solanum nigrescens]YP_010343853.1 hypothetical chloroplast RF2 [Solanum tweedianum]YP_010343936.1 hypothetical chloroplast RF2 [Solanum umalilaense]YP_010344212.1 hypothetical chloroplast RF2 [Solanum villosum]YP_010344544.1 hypothetical chloroplast RF2 [Solanum salamancae]YP_010344627.1 hypothetical chloroplast RF2 [Solanum salicifolium]YP_010344793.1 hypothetical chloroplast RF2 [Solanum scabrum]
MQFRRNQ